MVGSSPVKQSKRDIGDVGDVLELVEENISPVEVRRFDRDWCGVDSFEGTIAMNVYFLRTFFLMYGFIALLTEQAGQGPGPVTTPFMCIVLLFKMSKCMGFQFFGIILHS